MPPGFRHPGRTLRDDVEVWANAGFTGTPFYNPPRNVRMLPGAIARLKPGVNVRQAQTRVDALVARLRETFQFCDQALARLDDSKLGEQLPFFGRTMSRAGIMTLTTGDWAVHYSQAAIYLRLNGLLPPTAKKKEAQ